jgi:23S rRNA-/tRNA-specific pseudouridylate synthase
MPLLVDELYGGPSQPADRRSARSAARTESSGPSRRPHDAEEVAEPRIGFYLSEIKSGFRPSADEEERPLLARLSLHAESLAFDHPAGSQRVRLEAPLPKDFRATLAQLRKRS